MVTAMILYRTTSFPFKKQPHLLMQKQEKQKKCLLAINNMILAQHQVDQERGPNIISTGPLIPEQKILEFKASFIHDKNPTLWIPSPRCCNINICTFSYRRNWKNAWLRVIEKKALKKQILKLIELKISTKLWKPKKW